MKIDNIDYKKKLNQLIGIVMNGMIEKEILEVLGFQLDTSPTD